MKVAVLGNSLEDGVRMESVASRLNTIPNVEARADSEQIARIIREGKAGWMQEISDYMLYFIDKADAVLIVAYQNHASLAWIMGYCYKEGIPCIVYLEKQDGVFFTSTLSVTSLHALMQSMDDLVEYDWNEMPVTIPEIGYIKKRVVADKVRES